MSKTSTLVLLTWESIWMGPTCKVSGSVAGVRCWRPPVNGRQVTVFLLRSLCPRRQS